ncbi:MAG TPA: MOSC domain-containing protein [Candidatus Binatia bacterium]|jgi:MOSC domain-containing protein YiiM
MSQEEQTYSWETPPELWRGFKPTASTWSGKVISIFIAPDPSGSMVSVPEVRAFADRGLEGDRFFRDSWRAANRPDKAVSLIEEEVLEIAAKELGVVSIADKTRRNIVTGGVPLVELLQHEFVLGSVVMRGIRLFEPCGHLEKVSKVLGIFKTLERRSGLKAAILSDGVIRVGDRIALRPAASRATA